MRLIDADALFISKEYCLDEAGFGASYYVVHKSDIDEAPTIEAEPVKHGRWNLRNSCQRFGYYCSNCNIEAIYTGTKLNYRPNCGSKMDLEG